MRSEIAIKLNGDEAVGTGSQDLSNSAGSGADFDDGMRGDIPESVDDRRACRGINEEILA